MKSLCILVIGLGLTLTWALPALAHASPPDPSWIPGIYDAADFDDVVILVVSEAQNTLPVVLPAFWFCRQVVGYTAHLAEAAPDGPGSSAVHSRAPPAS